MTDADAESRRTRNILERITDAFVALDSEWRFTDVNAGAARIFSRRPEDLVGKHIWTEFPEGVGRPFYHASHKAVAERIPLQIEEYCPPANRWFEERIYPSAGGLSVFFRDVTERKQAELTRRDLERQLAEVQQIARLGSWELNFQTGEARGSRELLRLIGWGAEDTVGTLASALSFIHPDDTARVEREIAQARRRGGAFEFEARILHSDGGERTIRSRGRVVPDGAGQPQRLTAIAQDVTEERAAAQKLAQVEQARRRAEADHQALFEQATVGIFRATLEGRFLRVNPALAEIGGYESPEAQQEALTDLGEQLYVHPERHEELKRILREEGRVSGFESQVYRKDGSVIWISERARAVRDEAGAIRHYEGFVENVTARKLLDEERERILRDALDRADRDPLTGLLNHRAFHKRLEAETARAGREGASLAVAVLDLDNFKFFNEVYGHAVGDEVLKEVARRLSALCRAYDVVARFGGDEFALLLGGVGSARRRDIEARLNAGMAGTHFSPPNGEAAVPISVSLGVALFPVHSADRLQVVQLADERLRRAKTGAEADGEAGRRRTSLLRSVEGFSLLDALVTAVDNKDRYTRRHSEDVMTLSLQIPTGWGCHRRSRRRSPPPRCCTTWARSASPTRSCASRAG